jgi:geranylgeranyl diphosphate synthase type II
MTASDSFSLPEWAEPLRQQLRPRLRASVDDAVPARFAEACVYPLETGGKRVRPLLCIAACQAVSEDLNAATWAAAVAIELVHTYSLVHDDLPAMDDDDERRGRPTVHKAYNDGVAVLVGDALLTAAFEVLARVEDPVLAIALVRELSDAAGHRGMIAGQALDVGMEGPVRDLAGLQNVHRRKTGALIRGAVRMGALCGGASANQLISLTSYGEAVGLAFQLADDVLDADEDTGEDGPPSYVRLLVIALRSLATFTVRRDH